MAQNKQVSIPAYLQVSKIIAYLLYVWVIIGVISLVLRVFLLAFSANASTPFVEFIYRTSADYLQPFRGIFPAKEIGQTGYLDVAALFAVIVYLFVMWGFSSLIQYLQHRIDVSKVEQEKTIRLAKKNSPV